MSCSLAWERYTQKIILHLIVTTPSLVILPRYTSHNYGSIPGNALHRHPGHRLPRPINPAGISQLTVSFHTCIVDQYEQSVFFPARLTVEQSRESRRSSWELAGHHGVAGCCAVDAGGCECGSCGVGTRVGNLGNEAGKSGCALEADEIGGGGARGGAFRLRKVRARIGFKGKEIDWLILRFIMRGPGWQSRKRCGNGI
ncbi:hypothetical protein PMIN01_05895 [Paraphaeosphaeria minitans]|uniref:Uncharacterized protein n=1 Tax=Paraphaeosphaeria minitans TaxID=565426 RepID=A0A9P6GKE5_9PLEO|nr:hypothetical protein PMIN01_05895 [Paraphaeosphaeria minitans]